MEDSVLARFAQAIVSGSIRVIDLSQPLNADTAVIQLPPEFGKSWPFHLEEISHYDSRGPAWYWNNFSCGEHTGTHFDAPVHWVTGKDYPRNATDTIPVEKFFAPACVIDVSKRSRRQSRFSADAEARRGMGATARTHRGRLLGADAHRLVETHATPRRF